MTEYGVNESAFAMPLIAPAYAAIDAGILMKCNPFIEPLNYHAPFRCDNASAQASLGESGHVALRAAPAMFHRRFCEGRVVIGGRKTDYLA